jgi:hypothetical protein
MTNIVTRLVGEGADHLQKMRASVDAKVKGKL